MADPLDRIKRRLGLAALLLILLAQTTASAAMQEKQPSRGPFTDGPVTLLMDREYLPALLEGIDKARKEIALSAFIFKTNGSKDHQPDWVLSHLRDALRRGVKVHAIIDQGKEGEALTGSNVETAGKLKASGIDVCLDGPEKTAHAKMVIIDRRYLYIGSHNLTQSALKHNREVSVRIDSPAMAEEALRYMKTLCP
jgi:phosphatidylserine/phosphatidylglycerophosphate/cardiolipin synthase-like enzyme